MVQDRIDHADRASERNTWNRGAEVRKNRGHRKFDVRVEAIDRPDCLLVDRSGQVGERGDTALFVQQRQLLERDRSRLVEPPEVRRDVGEGRLEEHPGPRLVDVAERPQHGGVGVRRRVVEDGGQVGVGFEMTRANQRCGASQQALLRSIAADAGERSQLRKCHREGGGRLWARFWNRDASLSVHPARAWLAWARLWFRLADWRRASR